MDLWIRSQNRELLIKPNVLDLDLDDITIVCISNTEGEYTLGEYKTYERAIEVLDEIQDLLLGDIKRISDNSYIAKSSQKLIYEMPKE